MEVVGEEQSHHLHQEGVEEVEQSYRIVLVGVMLRY